MKLRNILIGFLILMSAACATTEKNTQNEIRVDTKETDTTNTTQISEQQHGMVPLVQLGHSGDIRSIAISRSGRYALSGSDDNTLKLWEIETGREIRTFSGHSDGIDSVAISPDGRYALSGSGEGILELWEIETGRKIGTFKGGEWRQSAVEFSPDGRFALSGDNMGSLRLWELSTGSEIRTFKGHSRGINSIAISPDGRYALSGDREGSLRLWELSTGREIRTFSGHSDEINSVAISPDGRYAISGSSGGDDKTVKLWELSTGKAIRVFQGHSGNVLTVTFSPDGRYALSGWKHSMVKLLEIATGREISTSQGPEWVYCLKFTPDGRYVLSTNIDDKALMLWDIRTGREVRTFKRSSEIVSSVAISSDGRYALSGSFDNTVKLWELSTGKAIRVFQGHSGPVLTVAISPDGRYAISGSDDKTLKLWEIATGREIRTFKGNRFGVESVAISPDGRYALSGEKHSKVKLWEIATGTIINAVQGDHNSNKALAITPDGRYALWNDGNDPAWSLTLWELSTARKIRTLGKNNAVAVAISQDGRYILSSHDVLKFVGGLEHRTGQLKLWEISTGREIRSFQGRQSEFSTIAISPNGRYALSGSNFYHRSDNTLSLFDLSSGKKIKTIKVNYDPIMSVVITPDGRYALTGGTDGTMRMWDISSSSEIAKMMGSPDGEWFISTPDGYYDNSAEGTDFLHYVYSGNRGNETFSFEQFESLFKKPDIIKERLSGNLNAAKRAPDIVPPPHLDMTDHMSIKETTSRSYPVNLTASAIKEVKMVRIFVNGKPVKELPVNLKEKQLSLEVPLFSGANRITALAYDENGFSSNPRYLDVICKDKGMKKPNLYVLAIGVSKYPRLSSDWQLEYAHTDAQALVKTLQKQEGKLYGEVRSNLLTNEKVNQGEITKALDALRGMTENDIAVIFMAGHGTRGKDGTFYFLTSSGNFNEPQNGGLSWGEMGKYLSKIKGRVVMLLDACHSGSIVTETVVPNDELARQFFSGGRGGVMVFSASKGRQFSLESPDIGGGFGVFTYGLSQALGPKSKEADTNGNGYVEFSELVDYVSKYVNKATKGNQMPWLSRKELFGDLPVAKVGN